MLQRLTVLFILLASGAQAQSSATAEQEALLRVQALAERFRQLDDKELAVDSLATLGQVTCRYDKQAGAAVLRSAVPVLRGADLDSDNHERLRGQLLRSANTCSAALADEILDATASPDVDPVRSAETALSAAFSRARSDPARAAEIAGAVSGAVASMNHSEAQQFTRFIETLHTQDSNAAESLYRQTLSTLQASPEGSLAALQALGNYPFRVSGGDDTASRMTGIGSVYVVDLAARRGTVSDEMALAYLQAAAEILALPVTGQDQQTYRHTLALQLAPHAETLAPDLVPVFQGVSEASGAALPEEIRAMPTARLGKSFEELQAEPGGGEKDDASRMLAARIHYSAGEFAEAREATARIEDEDLRERLERLITLGETLRAIDRGVPSIGELRPPLYGCLALLQLAARQFHDEGLAADAALTLSLAKAEAGKLDVSARPFLLLAAIGLDSIIDLESSLTTLSAAVAAFNALDEQQEKDSDPSSPDLERSRTQVDDSGVRELLRAGRAHTSIPVRVSRIDGYSFEKVLPVLLQADPERVEAIVEGLRSGRRRAGAEIYALELRLARAFRGGK